MHTFSAISAKKRAYYTIEEKEDAFISQVLLFLFRDPIPGEDIEKLCTSSVNIYKE